MEDVRGVECQICEGETFRIFTRKIVTVQGITAKIKCCASCAKLIDAEEEVKNKRRYETKAQQQEVSFRWADNLHGKKVVVLWQDDVNPVHFNKYDDWLPPKPIKQVKGTAYRYNNASGGWGQVKVILDREETKRVKLACHETMYCPIAKRDMYFVSDSFVCDKTDCKEQTPVMDGKRWGGPGLYPTEDGNYYILITWGIRNTIQLLDEISQK